MTDGFADRPFGRLTTHFFRALFDFGALGEPGADGLVRVILGSVSTMVALGLLLVRIYMGKYAALSGAASAGPYVQALPADDALAIAMPMWIVAFVAVLISHALFPDETDFRVLTPLPVRRSVIFGSKLVALARFLGVFTLAAHVAMTPLVLLISAGRWASDRVIVRLLAYWVSGVCASAFALLAVVSTTGVVTVCVPPSLRHRALVALRSLLLGALVLVAPLVLKLPAASAYFGRRSPLLYAAPPAWFVGVERRLLGHHDPFFTELAQLGALALAAAFILSVASYLALYRRFDRVMLRAQAVSRRGRLLGSMVPPLWTNGSTALAAWRNRPPARAAVRDFTIATLRRSALHQGVVIGLSACGLALALNSLVNAGILPWFVGLRATDWRVVGAVTWVPFALVIVMSVAARAALALPIEPRANWIFRMAEQDRTRCDHLSGAARVTTEVGVLAPAAMTFPLQWAVFGPRAILAVAVTVACGLLVVELFLRRWRRIPFTCSYLPGKHAVAHTAVVAFAGFTIFATIGGAIAEGSMRAPRAGAVLIAVLAGVLTLLRRARLARWRREPLMFDDQLPDELQVLGLSAH